MTSLPRFSVNNPVLVNLFMLTIIVGGGYAGLTLVREMFPQSDPDRIRISTFYPGATPSEVEKGITLKIEEAIKNIEGIEKVEATISEGYSSIIAELRNGFEDIDQAVNDVKAAVDSIPQDDWPEEALETQVAKFDPKLPVISIALYGTLSDRALKEYGEKLRDEVLALPGLSDVVLSGTRNDEISVEVSPDQLVKYSQSLIDIGRAIAASNLDLPGGQIKTSASNVAVRTLGEKDRGEELYDIIVQSDAEGRKLRLRDLAHVVDGFEDSDVIGTFMGQPAVDVTVYKREEQDAVQIARMVRALVAGKTGQPLERPWLDRALAKVAGKDTIEEIYKEALSSPYPAGVNLRCHTDLSVYIESRLDLLKRNGLWGLLLVFLSLLVFLNWRVAFWVMMGLLLAILGALIGMKMLGVSLNLLTMFGLIVVLGMLVDDGIIVAEHVFTKIEKGVEPKLAAITGTEEVTWPVVCAILTTMVAFFPLRYIEGRMGDWMGVLPLVVVIALSMSLVEALTILPAHLAHNVRPIGHKPKGELDNHARRLPRFLVSLRHLQQTMHQRAVRHYEWLLRLAVKYRYVTLAVLLSCMLVIAGLVGGNHVPFVFMQKMDSETLVASLRMGVGTPIAATREAMAVVEQAALDQPELKTIYTLLGLELTDDFLDAAGLQSNRGQAFIELQSADQRDRSSDEILANLRERTANIPGVDKLTFNAIHGGPGGMAIQLEISGARIEDIVTVADHFKNRLLDFAGVYDITDDFDAGRPELQIELLESARPLGITTESLALQVRAAFYGHEAKKIQRGREDVKIMVRYPPPFRRNIYDVESMYLKTPTGALVPFKEVARLREGTGYATIHRQDQMRTIKVLADVDETVTNSEQVSAQLSTEFDQIRTEYPGIKLQFGGQKLETARSFGSLKHLSVFALLLIYVILAALFRSYTQPLIVMSVVPFGVIGAVLGHLLLGYPLTLLSIIGMVALTGIVVNDSMILVSFINRRLEAGDSVLEAIVEGGKSRLRPILLTTATTVLGLAPLMLETSFQAKFMIPMAISISAGLIFATALTLIAVPALYVTVRDFKTGVRRAVQLLLGITPSESTTAS